MEPNGAGGWLRWRGLAEAGTLTLAHTQELLELLRRLDRLNIRKV